MTADHQLHRLQAALDRLRRLRSAPGFYPRAGALKAGDRFWRGWYRDPAHPEDRYFVQDDEGVRRFFTQDRALEAAWTAYGLAKERLEHRRP